MRQLLNIGDDCARRGDALGVLIERDFVKLERVAFFAERHPVVGMLHHLRNRVCRRTHAKRSEYPLPYELLPSLPGLQFDDVPDGREHQVVIEECFSHRLLWLQVLQPFEQILPRESRLEPDQIVPRYSCAVRQHVAQTDVVVELVVVKLDRRDGLAHGLIPSEFSFLDQHPRSNSREQLRI